MSSVTDRSTVVNLGIRMPGLGRPLPTVDGGYPVVQVWGQLSGVEIARPTGANAQQTAAALEDRFERARCRVLSCSGLPWRRKKDV